MGMFNPATRKQLKLRMAIDGPSGSGKTYTALRFAFALGQKVLAIDTEHGSMSKYRGDSPDGIAWNWNVCELAHFDPQNYTMAMKEARRFNPDVLIIDSLSHAWEGIGGALEQVSQSSSANKYTAWKDVTPKHQRMVETILAFPAHVIVTMRSKMEHVLEADERGRMVPRKVGMAPIQRPGTEYEFDIVCELDWDHKLTVTKTRCPAVDGMQVERPGPDFMQPVLAWLSDGEAVVATETGGVPSGPGRDASPPPADLRHSASEHDHCTPTQVDAIKRLAAELRMPTDSLRDVLHKKGVFKIGELTIGQADELILKMQLKFQQMQLEQKSAARRSEHEDIPF